VVGMDLVTLCLYRNQENGEDRSKSVETKSLDI
jgi:hypothetical protein